jgi:hypothetical protein
MIFVIIFITKGSPTINNFYAKLMSVAISSVNDWP